jgi:hypothetical protein
MQTTVLTQAKGYNTKRMVFSDVVELPIPNSTMKYRRITISNQNPNGTVGDLVIPTEEVFSYGIQPTTDLATKKQTGYQLPLCLYERDLDRTTPAQRNWVETFNAICEKCKDHIFEHKDEIGFQIESKNELRKMNPLYWKKDPKTKKVVEGTGPTLYVKLITRRRKEGGDVILTNLYTDTTTLDPLSALNKRCRVTAAIKFESIYIGADKCTLQVKVYEARLHLLEENLPSLLGGPTKSLVTSAEGATMNDMGDDDGNTLAVEDDEEGGALVSSPPTPPRTEAKTPAITPTKVPRRKKPE